MKFISPRYRLVMKIASLAASLALLLTVAAVDAQTLKGDALSKYAHISLQTARLTALKTIPGGKIVDQELEREAGGSGLRYSFDVKIGKTTREVGVDAKTGKVLENSIADKD